jgi:hypothetical protein
MTEISKALLRCVAVATRPTIHYPKPRNIPFPQMQLVVPHAEWKATLISAEQANILENESLPFKVNGFTETLFESADLTVPKGIPNEGNTCFIASVIQASILFQKSAFEEKLKHASDEEKAVIQSILGWIRSSENRKNTAHLGPFLQILQRYGIYNGNQEDAAEFLTWIGNYLPNPKVYFHQITKTAPLNSGEFIIEDEGNQTQFVREIPLEVERDSGEIKAGQTLLGLIKKFFSENDVSNQNLFLDRLIQEPKGNISERRLPLLSRREILSEAPQELTFQIKKFYQDRVAGTLQRINGTLSDVPEQFDLPAEYCANGEQATYQLRSVICHRGTSPHSGHYIAYVRKGKFYYCANDDLITKIDRPMMLKAARDGYILIYDKIARA